MNTNYEHFEGKDVVEHLAAAREKGAKATAEVHGTEMPGYLSAAADSLKETALLLLGMWLLFSAFSVAKPLGILGIFCNSDERHGLNRWKEELTAMYRQKGLTGALLDQVIEVLMADDNRLLRVMLEEELGLTLESYEHPLKQAAGAGGGVLLAVASGTLGFFLGGTVGIVLLLTCAFGIATILASKWEGNEIMKSLIWNLAVGALGVGSIFLLARWIGS